MELYHFPANLIRANLSKLFFNRSLQTIYRFLSTVSALYGTLQADDLCISKSFPALCRYRCRSSAPDKPTVPTQQEYGRTVFPYRLLGRSLKRQAASKTILEGKWVMFSTQRRIYLVADDWMYLWCGSSEPAQGRASSVSTSDDIANLVFYNVEKHKLRNRLCSCLFLDALILCHLIHHPNTGRIKSILQTALAEIVIF